jgi:RNA polymerase sigma-70 factor (ECF subfamily)
MNELDRGTFVSAPNPPDAAQPPTAFDAVREAVADALARCDVAAARRAIVRCGADAGAADAGAWVGLRDVGAWPDAWLVAAARCERADVLALDALVGRYWKLLYTRCEMLTMDRERARDLAQETWVRVLRARRSLQPDGSVSGYLVTVATNIWRDWHRSAHRAGPLSEHRLASIDAEIPGDDGNGASLGDLLPDPNALSHVDQALLRVDVDRALARLSPRSRDLLTARYLDGESAVEIGRRYDRTEQTISAWVRQAIGEIRQYLAEAGDRPWTGSEHA